MRPDMILPAILFITLLGSLYTLFTQAPYAQLAVGRHVNNETQRTIPRKLFSSLEQLARLVDISYCVGSTGIQKPFKCLSHCADFEDLELITTWNTGLFFSDSCGYIALSHPPSPKRILVAFRGTYSIADTIVDLSAYPQPYAPYDPKKVEYHAHNERRSPRCLNCTVHAGFITSWQNTRDTILHHVAAAREQHPDYALVLIGHSLGGAVAALAGIEMDLRGWDPQVTTFGEPKVGNDGLANYIGELFGLGGDNGAGETRHPPLHEDPQDRRWRYRRVTHVNDPVPLLPLTEWKYAMHAGEIFISKTDLPPSVSDVQYCEGAHDPRCISGVEEDTLAAALQRAAVTLEDEKTRPSEQAALSYRRASRSVAGPLDDDERYEHEQRLPFHLPWDLTLPRYRLWGPLLAHRDYFWRLGVCVPGGDPTGGWK
ncbi:alpha/beta-hydrolase [Aspergillus taichungensis]|uniref:feruloyl esterase n=1 Tax=Aspergillus taichungensis TaxID=482145 RepID=A0A2J5I2X7_9EURO|nr:alpha/beta-hydrolase [Aspergillus taichungensis]